MRLDAGQHMRMDQRMKLDPRMIQSMEILQMPMPALEERIEQELASNPTLELAEAGSIIFTTSTVGHVAKPFWGAYGVSKFALEGLAASWAQELAEVSRVRINTINPGATRTDMRAQAYPAEDPTELATPAQIMPSYLYLLCDASRQLSGARLDAQG